MKLPYLYLEDIQQRAAIYPISLDDPDIYEIGGVDIYEAGAQAEKVFNRSNIRLDRNKDITIVAIVHEKVVGAVATSWSRHGDYDDAMVFAWDVAVLPEYRNGSIGLQLIDAAITEYEVSKNDYEGNTIMRVWAVNPKLARILESKFGFTVESEYSNGHVILVKY